MTHVNNGLIVLKQLLFSTVFVNNGRVLHVSLATVGYCLHGTWINGATV